ncbi:MAG: hypothetical protein ACE5K2_02410 [Candidatus Zixiibacteriota bacterium]
MKKLFFLLVVILIIAFGCTQDQTQRIESLEQENAALKALVAPPPSSLDVLYPPRTEQPEYLFRMFGMSTPYSGIVADLLEEDFQNVKVNLENFKGQYIEVSKLVPEWEKDFPLSPIDEFEKALESGDQATVMGAFEKLGKVCHDCHVKNMAKVQQKYRWGDFDAIKVKDPLTEEEVNFTRLKQNLDANFTGAFIDVVQDQGENAQKHFQGFKARFQALQETCQDCHGTDERKYYVGESIQTLINGMEKALGASPVDPKVVEELLMGIRMESCDKCHLVHIPAAYTQLQWKK